MSDNTRPKWMSDPLVAQIDSGKLDFLQSVVFETRGKSQKELIPFLMKIMKEGKAKKISFSDEEMAAIMAAIKKNSTPDELAQIEKFMEMHKKGMLKAPK